MKTTIDLPDQLMDEVENLAAREQRQVNEVVADLVRAGLLTRAKSNGVNDTQSDGEKWLQEWFALADELMADVPPGPTARELLEEDRNRLERK